MSRLTSASPRHTVDEMKRDRVIGKMRAQEAFKRHLERV